MNRPITECPLWRWMPGMVIRLHGDSNRIESAQDVGVCTEIRAGTAHIMATHHRFGGESATDPSDPATVGCLLALVRDAWGIPGLGVHCDRNGTAGGWVVSDGTGKPGALRRVFAPTEWDALCAALWAATERAP